MFAANNKFKGGLDVELVSAAFAIPGIAGSSFRASTTSQLGRRTSSKKSRAVGASTANTIGSDEGAGGGSNADFANNSTAAPTAAAMAAAYAAGASSLSSSAASGQSRIRNVKQPTVQFEGLSPLPDAQPPPFVPTSDQDNTDSYNKVRQLIFNQALKYNVTKAEQSTVNFNEIAETDTGELLETHVKQDLASNLGEGDTFRLVMLGMVFLDAISIAIQANSKIVLAVSYYWGANLFMYLNRVFVGIFVMEILFKWYYGFSKFWRSWWNIFDVLIVIVQLSEPVHLVLAHIGILRVIRIFRPFKSHRTMPILSGAQIVMQTIADSSADVANICVLLIMITYIWSVIGVTLFGVVQPIDFGSIDRTFYTLFVTVTMIGWMEIFEELEKKGYFVVAAIYFSSYLVIASLVFMKIVVAVVVANVEEAYKLMEIQKRAQNRRLKTTRSSKSALSGKEAAVRRAVNMPRRDHEVWKTQIPYELPNFDNLSKERLEKYLIVLAIIEDSMAEYMRIKEELKKIQVEVKQLNQMSHESQEANEGDELDEMDGEDPLIDDRQFGGDALSQLMRSRNKNDARKVSIK